MKKENKQLAQQRRAKEKKVKAIKNMVKKVSMIAIPTLVLATCIVIIIATSVKGEKGATTTDSETTSSSESSQLLTDQSLEVKDGDTVNIDYVGSIDGVEFDGGNTQGQGADLTIGSGMYIDDFEEQLIGAHPGDEVELNVTFPESYGNEELNGKDALFKVVINGIYE